MKSTSDQPTNKVVTFVAVATALALIGDSMLYVVLPIYYKEAGLDSLWQVGVILSINRFVRLPLHPFIGYFYKKTSLRTGIIIALVLAVISTLGYGLASGFVLWILLRCIWGIAWSLLKIGGMSTAVFYSTAANRGRVIGLYNGIYRIGSLVGMLVGGIIVPFMGFSTTSIIFGFMSMIGIPLIWMAVSGNTHTTDIDNPTASINGSAFVRYLLNKRTLLIISSGFIIALLFQGVFASIISTALEFNYGENIMIFGWLFTVTALAGIIQALRWMWEPFLASKIGALTDGYKGRIPIYIGSLVIAAISFGLLALNMNVIIWIIVCIVVMLAATSLTTVSDAFASDSASSSSIISFITLYSIVLDLGSAAGPILAFSIISFTYGLQAVFIASSIILLILALFWVFALVHDRKEGTKIYNQRKEEAILK
ncbi:MFS transporter [Ornithinibacillus sp. 4-3]|uniref:MFS transporter n=1 Tax=Ornithinibacillus sp. 4-3 TaxID=3231488 RepID=A0AB39HQL9_9BACI